MKIPREWLAVRVFVLSRASHICEGCGAARAEEVHHRQPRGMGGVHGPAAFLANSPCNLLALCLPCHAFTEDEPAEARKVGWLIPHFREAGRMPALITPIYGKGWYYLLADLSYLPCEEAEALRQLDMYGLS